MRSRLPAAHLAAWSAEQFAAGQTTAATRSGYRLLHIGSTDCGSIGTGRPYDVGVIVGYDDVAWGRHPIDHEELCHDRPRRP